VILGGCARQRASQELQDLHAKAADFRYTVIQPNTEKVVDDLLYKLDSKYFDENQLIYKVELGKLQAERDKSVVGASSEEVIAAYKKYADSVDKLNQQLINATRKVKEDLKVYKEKNYGPLRDQFNRSAKADTEIMRYFMGLKPSEFDTFLTGKPVITP